MSWCSWTSLPPRTTAHHGRRGVTYRRGGLHTLHGRGGVRSVDDARHLLRAGPTRWGQHRAVDRPDLIAELADEFGSQCVCGRRRPPSAGGAASGGSLTHGGRTPAGLDALEWTERCAAVGAGRSCSPPWTGTGRGRVRPGPHRQVAERCPVPVIASGGVGNLQHLADGPSRVGPRPCWPRPSSISASSPSPGQGVPPVGRRRGPARITPGDPHRADRSGPVRCRGSLLLWPPRRQKPSDQP